MARGHDLILRLRDPSLPAKQRAVALREFAKITGWRPSFEVDYPPTNKFAGSHLLVEHGLQPITAITFLLASYPFTQLDPTDQYRLLSISYNNLVDWHCFPDQNGIQIIFNRTRPFTSIYVSIADPPAACRSNPLTGSWGALPRQTCLL